MPEFRKIKHVKELVRRHIDGGETQQAGTLLGDNTNSLNVFPIYLNDVKNELVLAKEGMDRLVTLASGIPDPYEKALTLGMFYMLSKKPSEALHYLSNALELRPDDPLACLYAGRACVQKGLFKEAVQLIRAPQEQMLPESWLELGRVKNSLNDISGALVSFEKSFELLADDESYLTLLVFLRDQLKMAQNLDSGFLQRMRTLLELGYKEFPEYQPELDGLTADLASITGEYDKAELFYRKVLESQPENISAKNNLACILFTLGRFEEGYQYNSDRDILDGKILDTYGGIDNTPQWNGETLNGKSLVIFEEQGIGDRILHYRYLQALTKKYTLNDVVVIVQERLKPLLERSGFKGVRFISTDATHLELNGFDYRCYLFDLARYFGPKSDDVKPLGKYLTPDPILSGKYKERYRELFPNNLKIGINWKSDSLVAGKRKNLPLNEMGAFLKLKGVQWICLQYGDIEQDLAELKAQTGADIFVDKTVDQVNDIDAAFAQLSALDMVITISNATAHFAGALGIETLVLTPKVPLWHWLLNRSDSCWYRSISLIRQTEFNTWESEFKQLHELLLSKGALIPEEPITVGELYSLLSRNKLDEMVELYERIDLEKLTTKHKKLFAEALLALRLYGECNKLITPLSAEAADDPELILLFAKVGKGKGQFDDALTLLGQVNSPELKITVALERLTCLLGKGVAIEQLWGEWQELLTQSRTSFDVDLITKFFMEQREFLQRQQITDLNRLSFCEKALESFEAKHGNRNPIVGLVLKADLDSLKGDYVSAISHFKKALKIRPEIADQLNLSMAYSLLAVGEFEQGFKNLTKRLEFDKRLTNHCGVSYDQIPKLTPQLLKKLASNPENTCLMVNAEQGIGDQVLNLHFLEKFLQKYPFKVVLRLNRKLVAPVARLRTDFLFVGQDSQELPQEVLAQVDAQMTIADAPQYILEEYKAYKPVSEVIKPDPEKVARFRSEYKKQFGNKKLVGLSWRSASVTWGGSKDLSLNDFLPILKDPEIQCISIQYADVADEIDKCNRENGTDLFLDRTFDPTEDVDTVLAQIAALDHVVTISNVNAHFAGSLQVPTEVILKRMALWHWHVNTNQSLWYPTVSLHREEEFNQWGNIITSIHKGLHADQKSGNSDV